MNKRDFLTLLAVAPSATLPAVASDLARFELSGWRPIETAPRDRPVLVLADKKLGSIAEFGQRIAVGQFHSEYTRANGHLCTDFCIHTHYHGDIPVDALVSASHWQPLPEEPK